MYKRNHPEIPKSEPCRALESHLMALTQSSHPWSRRPLHLDVVNRGGNFGHIPSRRRTAGILFGSVPGLKRASRSKSFRPPFPTRISQTNAVLSVQAFRVRKGRRDLFRMRGDLFRMWGDLFRFAKPFQNCNGRLAATDNILHNRYFHCLHSRFIEYLTHLFYSSLHNTSYLHIRNIAHGIA